MDEEIFYPDDMPDVFFVMRLLRVLEKQFGIELWMDLDKSKQVLTQRLHPPQAAALIYMTLEEQVQLFLSKAYTLERAEQEQIHGIARLMKRGTEKWHAVWAVHVWAAFFDFKHEPPKVEAFAGAAPPTPEPPKPEPQDLAALPTPTAIPTPRPQVQPPQPKPEPPKQEPPKKAVIEPQAQPLQRATAKPDVKYAVQMKGIAKRFGQVLVLDSVDLLIEEGIIHALVGENGAGKTTLMRILYGDLQPEAGTYSVGGAAQKFTSTSDAIRAGVGMVSQHYSIISELTCLQNLMLGAETGSILNLVEAKSRAEELAKSMGFQFDWDALAANLSPAAAQKLEILKLLWRKSKVMILDEPTAMLSPADSDALFVSLKKLTEGGATVILVTHRLPEVMAHAKCVTVLRGGRRVIEKEVAETNPDELAEAIVGHPMVQPAPRDTHHSPRLLLEARRLFVKGEKGEEALKGIDIMLHAGEILGVAGVDGNGQRELLGALLGTAKLQTGRIVFDGEDIAHQDAKYRIGLGLRMIPEDRTAEGMVLDWSIEENVALGLQHLPPMCEGNFIKTSGRRVKSIEIADRFGAKYRQITQRIGELSGGNQQRVVVSRGLALNPCLILAFQPARGLDIDGTVAFYQALHAECKKGAAAIVVSFDLDELLQYCDRIIVMNRGRVLSPSVSLQKDRNEIGKLMVGA